MLLLLSNTTLELVRESQMNWCTGSSRYFGTWDKETQRIALGTALNESSLGKAMISRGYPKDGKEKPQHGGRKYEIIRLAQ